MPTSRASVPSKITTRLVSLAYGWLRFTAMTVVGMLMVWALVLIFG